MKTNLTKKFQDLLLKFSQAEELNVRNGIEDEIWQEFGEEHAVFDLDMSGKHYSPANTVSFTISPWSSGCS